MLVSFYGSLFGFGWKRRSFVCIFFFFNDTATTEIYTLSLHDALPISHAAHPHDSDWRGRRCRRGGGDRKSTRLNSSHGYISYAVFCLKKKKTNSIWTTTKKKKTKLNKSYKTCTNL